MSRIKAIVLTLICVRAESSACSAKPKMVADGITLFPEFLSSQEVEKLRSLSAGGSWKPLSTAQYDDEVQTAMSARDKTYVHSNADPVTAEIIARIGSMLKIDVSTVDRLPFVRSRGSHVQIGSHIDAFLPDTEGDPGVVPDASILIYLTHSDEATEFPNAATTIRATPGSMLLFRNVDDAGHPSNFTAHHVRQLAEGSDRLLIQMGVAGVRVGERTRCPPPARIEGGSWWVDHESTENSSLAGQLCPQAIGLSPPPAAPPTTPPATPPATPLLFADSDSDYQSDTSGHSGSEPTASDGPDGESTPSDGPDPGFRKYRTNLDEEEDSM